MLDPFYPVVPDATWVKRLVPIGTRLIQLLELGEPRIRAHADLLREVFRVVGRPRQPIRRAIQKLVVRFDNGGEPLDGRSRRIWLHSRLPDALALT